MNIWDIVVLVIIGFAVILAIRHLQKRKQSGCLGCCSSCTISCHAHRENIS